MNWYKPYLVAVVDRYGNLVDRRQFFTSRHAHKRFRISLKLYPYHQHGLWHIDSDGGFTIVRWQAGRDYAPSRTELRHEGGITPSRITLPPDWRDGGNRLPWDRAD